MSQENAEPAAFSHPSRQTQSDAEPTVTDLRCRACLAADFDAPIPRPHGAPRWPSPARARDARRGPSSSLPFGPNIGVCPT